MKQAVGGQFQGKTRRMRGFEATSNQLKERIRTAGEGQASFTHAPAVKSAPDPAIKAEATRTATGVHDNALREALETLTENFLSRAKSQRGRS